MCVCVCVCVCARAHTDWGRWSAELGVVEKEGGEADLAYREGMFCVFTKNL